MKDILTIVFRLTLSCILAGTVMGTTFVFTNKAKKHNEHVKEERVAYSLLGYEGETPGSVAMHVIYRYVVAAGSDQFIGYLVPSGKNGENGFLFVQIDLDGQLASQAPVELAKDKALEPKSRDAAIVAAIGPGKTIRFADQTQVVTDDGQRAA